VVGKPRRRSVVHPGTAEDFAQAVARGELQGRGVVLGHVEDELHARCVVGEPAEQGLGVIGVIGVIGEQQTDLEALPAGAKTPSMPITAGA
jgi:hypothetical protein